MQVLNAIPEIQYETIQLQDLKLKRADPKNHARRITSIEVDGHRLIPTERFMTSFCAIYGVSPSIFNYFDPEEVISRIVATKKKSNANGADQKIRLAYEKHGHREIALAVSRPNKPFLTKGEIETVLISNGMKLEDTDYANGVIMSWHRPRIGGKDDFEVMGDVFQNRFVVETPIDGYGSPAAFLSTLREVCNNGIIAYSKVFRSQVTLGREQTDALNTMLRFLESFNNEEGFAAMRQRLIAASQSPASLEEFFSIYSIFLDDDMATLHKDKQGNFCKPFASVLIERLKELCGSLEVYGLVNYDALTKKKRRTIPTAGRLYDLINFVTEQATHDASPRQSRILHQWVGGLLSTEFDLEGILETTGEDPADLFMGDVRTGGDKFGLQGDRAVVD